MEFNTKKIKSTWKRSLFGDFDGDGVMNAFDCQPKNKKKQDSDKESLKEQLKRIQEEQMEDMGIYREKETGIIRGRRE